MNIYDAEKRCEELNKQILSINKEYDFGGWAKCCGQGKVQPLRDELDKLLLALIKAKEMTKVEI